MSECVLKTLACWSLRVGPSKFCSAPCWLLLLFCSGRLSCIIAKGPFRTKNAMVLESLVCCYRRSLSQSVRGTPLRSTPLTIIPGYFLAPQNQDVGKGGLSLRWVAVMTDALTTACILWDTQEEGKVLSRTTETVQLPKASWRLPPLSDILMQNVLGLRKSCPP